MFKVMMNLSDLDTMGEDRLIQIMIEQGETSNFMTFRKNLNTILMIAQFSSYNRMACAIGALMLAGYNPRNIEQS